MNIVFIGTPEFGAIILEELCKANYKPVLVVTTPDKPIGRKQTITPPPVKILAQKYDIPILQPYKIQDTRYPSTSSGSRAASRDKIQAVNPDLIVVAAYGKIIPKEILDIPKKGSLNIHPSLLPSLRGASPIQYTILTGKDETGVSIILMDDKMDHGPVIASSKSEIRNQKITYEELAKKLAKLGAELIIKTIPKWISGEIKPAEQDESKATFTKILQKEDGRIDWKKQAIEIERQIRAFETWPETFCFYSENEKRLRMKILKADVLEQTDKGPYGPSGKTFLAPDDKIAVQTGKDFLIITDLQLEGKKPTTSEDFLRGHSDFIGIILE